MLSRSTYELTKTFIHAYRAPLKNYHKFVILKTRLQMFPNIEGRRSIFALHILVCRHPIIGLNQCVIKSKLNLINIQSAI